jgi:hypothetical protein
MNHSIVDVERLSTEISCCEIARGLVGKPIAGTPCYSIVASSRRQCSGQSTGPVP